MNGLTQSDIQDILQLVDGSDFDELKLQMGDLTLELRRRGAPPAATETTVPTPAPVKRAPENTPSVVDVAGGTKVPAPLLGTFYHAPKPGADAFVKVGDTVTEDTAIGIIEVMKLMNSVRAGVTGTITEIIAPDGQLVEFGQALIRVQTA